MLILALDSSAAPASAALLEDGKILSEFYINTKQTHSQTLMPMVESVLKLTNKTLDDVTCMAVSAGPGSFTGVRIGVSCVKGLSMTRNIPCAGVSTLRAMAENARQLTGIVCAVMDARCGQVYNALFRAAVSYTHLDVYKRQGIPCGAKARAVLGGPRNGRDLRKAKITEKGRSV